MVCDDGSDEGGGISGEVVLLFTTVDVDAGDAEWGEWWNLTGY